MDLTIIFLCVILLVYFIVSDIRNKKELQTLKTEYQIALRSGDKQAALIAGRNYYSALRKGKLTIYDEQAISNDLAAMK